MIMDAHAKVAQICTHNVEAGEWTAILGGKEYPTISSRECTKLTANCAAVQISLKLRVVMKRSLISSEAEVGEVSFDEQDGICLYEDEFEELGQMFPEFKGIYNAQTYVSGRPYDYEHWGKIAVDGSTLNYFGSVVFHRRLSRRVSVAIF